MTGTEERYAQIEKETLGLLFGCGKFQLSVWITDLYCGDEPENAHINQKKEPQ